MARGDYEEPTEGATRYCTEKARVREVFAEPTSFTKGWDSTGTGGKPKGSLWIPKCPRGFVPMGGVASLISAKSKKTSGDFTLKPEDVPNFRCLARQFVEGSAAKELIWSDYGVSSKSNKGIHTARVWAILGSNYWMVSK